MSGRSDYAGIAGQGQRSSIRNAISIGLGQMLARQPAPRITDAASAQFSTACYGVNDAGQVVGSGAIPVSGNSQAMMWQDGVRQELGTLGGISSRALAINAGGQIVGTSAEAGDASWSAFIYDQGRMWELAPLVKQGGRGWVLESADAINDRGQIVGIGRHNGRYRPFLLTPLPANAAAP